MSKCPLRSDYESEEEYQEAYEAWESAEYMFIEESRDRYYGI